MKIKIVGGDDLGRVHEFCCNLLFGIFYLIVVVIVRIDFSDFLIIIFSGQPSKPALASFFSLICCVYISFSSVLGRFCKEACQYFTLELIKSKCSMEWELKAKIQWFSRHQTVQIPRRNPSHSHSRICTILKLTLIRPLTTVSFQNECC